MPDSVALGAKKSSTRSTCSFRSEASNRTVRTLAKFRKLSSRFCSRWHSLLHDRDLGRGPAIARRFGLGEILGQQLHVEPDRRQRILDLVRQAAGQLRDLGVLVDQLAG